MSQLNNIISKVFVINLKHRKDRWIKIRKNFKNIGIKLHKWNAIYGKNLSEQQIHEMTTPFCYYFCSLSSMGCWLSHYSLWNYIIKNKLTNVLILEDDAYPEKDFEDKFIKGWAYIPQDYDFVFLGCAGSCMTSTNLFSRKSNQLVKKLNDFQIIRPAYPLTTHAYIISYQGAKKIIEDPKSHKINDHIDQFLAQNIFPKKDYKVFAFVPAIVSQDLNPISSDNASKDHLLLTSILKKLLPKNQNMLIYGQNSQIVTLRKIGFSLTPFGIVFMAFSFLIGLICDSFFLKIYLGLLIFYYFIEMSVSYMNYKNMLYELILVILFTLLGHIVRNIMSQQIKSFKKLIL
jgi:glycosyl transferase, family 25